LIVWAENSLDRDPRTNPEIFQPIVGELRAVGAPLLAGAILDEGARFTNSTILVTPEGEITQRYDKQHLVPFGEYVPIGFFRRLVPALDRELPTNGRAGTQPVLFTVAGARIGTAICFESTYPEVARGLVRAGAQLLVVNTNDASFGTSPASRQHLAMAQMRAIEFGRTVVQAAIAGPSAIIHADGRIEQRTGLFRPAVVRARVPLASGRSLYARAGGVLEMLYLLAAAAAAAWAFVRRRA